MVLGILFLLPVTFLLFLYPSTHNYNSLDTVSNNKVLDLSAFTSNASTQVMLSNKVTVLGFLGETPLDKAIAASNLKELIYDKFKGFKGFQVVIVLPNSAKDKVSELTQILGRYDELKYWKYVFGSKKSINRFYSSLMVQTNLDSKLASEDVFIIDKELNQRGRLDDRTETEKEKKVKPYGLYTYNCIDIDVIKNKMASEDLRVLFTEYRQKRKGNFDSSARRDQDIKTNNDE